MKISWVTFGIAMIALCVSVGALVYQMHMAYQQKMFNDKEEHEQFQSMCYQDFKDRDLCECIEQGIVDFVGSQDIRKADAVLPDIDDQIERIVKICASQRRG